LLLVLLITLLVLWSTPSLQASCAPQAAGETQAASEAAVLAAWVVAVLVVISLVFWWVGRSLEQALAGRSRRSLPAHILEQLAQLPRSSQLASLVVVALLLRLPVALLAPGHPIDEGYFAAWADRAYAENLVGFYEDGVFADYPPGYVYVLWAIGAVRSAVESASSGPAASLLLRLPAILADLGLVVLLTLWGRRRLGPLAGVCAGLFVALNPALILNSSAWGQVDSVLALPLIATFVLWHEQRWAAAGLAYSAAVLIKPQALILGLILLFLVIRHLREREFRPVATAVGTGLAGFVAGVLPFAVSRPLTWVVDLYTSTMSSYNFATVNAANLWALTGGNWVDASQPVAGLAYTTWWRLALVGIVIVAAALFFRHPDRRPTLPVAAFVGVAVFVLAVRMHERYLFPSLLLCLAAMLTVGDRRFLSIATLLSAAHFCNVGQAYALALQGSYQIDRFDGFFMLAALLHVALLVKLTTTSLDVLWRSPAKIVAGGGAGAPKARRKL
jgi:Gpi18-like mannosyltransferase